MLRVGDLRAVLAVHGAGTGGRAKEETLRRLVGCRLARVGEGDEDAAEADSAPLESLPWAVGRAVSGNEADGEGGGVCVRLGEGEEEDEEEGDKDEGEAGKDCTAGHEEGEGTEVGGERSKGHGEGEGTEEEANESGATEADRGGRLPGSPDRPGPAGSGDRRGRGCSQGAAEPTSFLATTSPSSGPSQRPVTFPPPPPPPAPPSPAPRRPWVLAGAERLRRGGLAPLSSPSAPSPAASRVDGALLAPDLPAIFANLPPPHRVAIALADPLPLEGEGDRVVPPGLHVGILRGPIDLDPAAAAGGEGSPAGCRPFLVELLGGGPWGGPGAGEAERAASAARPGKRWSDPPVAIALELAESTRLSSFGAMAEAGDADLDAAWVALRGVGEDAAPKKRKRAGGGAQ